MLSQINPVDPFTIHFSNIQINIIPLYLVLTIAFLGDMYLALNK
jgi:hypothetical protein